MTEPKPVHDLDPDLAKFLGTSKHLLWWIVIAQGVLLVAVSVVAGILSIRQLSERSRIESVVTQLEASQCSWYALIGSIPPDPKTTSRLGVERVENSRAVVHSLGCPQPLPPPSPELIRLGLKYGIRITY